ncbi:hypothetical protein D3C81_498860 [compost metagenome]
MCRERGAKRPRITASRHKLLGPRCGPFATQGLCQALDIDGDLQCFQRRLDLDAQRCPQLHYPGLMGGFAVMMFLDTALG